MKVVDKLELVPHESDAAADAPSSARVISLWPQITLGRLVAPTDGGWLVEVGRRELEAVVDETVDPELLVQARETGARVVLEGGAAARIVGLLTTRRALEVDREGVVSAKVRRLALDVAEEALLRAPGAFVRLEPHAIELYANRALVRGREIVRVLSSMIKLN